MKPTGTDPHGSTLASLPGPSSLMTVPFFKGDLRRLWLFGLAMALGLTRVLGVNLAMEKREAQAALEDFRQDQLKLAEAAASIVQSRLDSAPEVPLGQALRGLRALEHLGLSRVFVQAPGQPWLGLSGLVPANSPLAGIPGNSGAFLVPRDQAPALGLPPRMAALGHAGALTASGACWKVAVAGTVYRERDRAQQARWRLVLSFASTAAFLFMLIRWALRLQKKELELAAAIELREWTERKDRELSQANRAATVLTLASGVAHEIGTPLGVISGRAGQLQARLGPDQPNQRLIQTILDQVEHINQTVRRFLDLARGGATANQAVDPLQLMESAIAKVEHRFEKAAVGLALEAPAGAASLRGDFRLLEHLLVNLLLNACDASQPGDRVILRAQGEPEGLALEVLDQGKGIPADLAERVLEPFFTTKPSGLGSGLGLPIAKEIVRMHMGRLEFESLQPRGTRVRVSFPGA